MRPKKYNFWHFLENEKESLFTNVDNWLPGVAVQEGELHTGEALTPAGRGDTQL